MSKKTNEQETQVPEFVQDLLTNGTTVLAAPTREGIAEMLDKIPSECKYCAGGVGYNFEREVYMLRVDVIRN